MKILLLFTSGGLQGQKREVILASGQSATVGRDPDNGIALDPSVDRSASAHHAKLFNERGEPFIYDIGSSYGTYVNGKAAPKTRLKAGDVVQFGTRGPSAIVYFPGDGGVGGPCPLCTKPVPKPAFTCPRCRRLMCPEHFDGNWGACVGCAHEMAATGIGPMNPPGGPARARSDEETVDEAPARRAGRKAPPADPERKKGATRVAIDVRRLDSIRKRDDERSRARTDESSSPSAPPAPPPPPVPPRPPGAGAPPVPGAPPGVPPGAAEEWKRCPFCAEPIRREAIKCKHCGEFMPGAVPPTAGAAAGAAGAPAPPPGGRPAAGGAQAPPAPAGSAGLPPGAVAAIPGGRAAAAPGRPPPQPSGPVTAPTMPAAAGPERTFVPPGPAGGPPAGRPVGAPPGAAPAPRPAAARGAGPAPPPPPPPPPGGLGKATQLDFHAGDPEELRKTAPSGFAPAPAAAAPPPPPPGRAPSAPPPTRSNVTLDFAVPDATERRERTPARGTPAPPPPGPGPGGRSTQLDFGAPAPPTPPGGPGTGRTTQLDFDIELPPSPP